MPKKDLEYLIATRGSIALIVIALLCWAINPGCTFSPGGTPVEQLVDATNIDATNRDGDGGIDSGSLDASPDASVDPNSVAIELTTPDNVRSGHPEETLLKLLAGDSVLSCELSATTPSGNPLVGWNGTFPVTTTPFQVAMEKGLNTLMASCITADGQHPEATLEVRAMYLEGAPGGIIAWDAPDVHGKNRCTAIAIPQVNGGLSNGGSYSNPDSRPWAPVGNTLQGMACSDGTIHYRATITHTAP